MKYVLRVSHQMTLIKKKLCLLGVVKTTTYPKKFFQLKNQAKKRPKADTEVVL